MAVSNKELNEAYGVSEEELHEMEASADAYDRGEWPEGAVTLMGRFYPGVHGLAAVLARALRWRG